MYTPLREYIFLERKNEIQNYVKIIYARLSYIKGWKDLKIFENRIFIYVNLRETSSAGIGVDVIVWL